LFFLKDDYIQDSIYGDIAKCFNNSNQQNNNNKLNFESFSVIYENKNKIRNHEFNNIDDNNNELGGRLIGVLTDGDQGDTSMISDRYIGRSLIYRVNHNNAEALTLIESDLDLDKRQSMSFGAVIFITASVTCLVSIMLTLIFIYKRKTIIDSFNNNIKNIKSKHHHHRSTTISTNSTNDDSIIQDDIHLSSQSSSSSSTSTTTATTANYPTGNESSANSASNIIKYFVIPSRIKNNNLKPNLLSNQIRKKCQNLYERVSLVTQTNQNNIKNKPSTTTTTAVINKVQTQIENSSSISSNCGSVCEVAINNDAVSCPFLNDSISTEESLSTAQFTKQLSQIPKPPLRYNLKSKLENINNYSDQLPEANNKRIYNNLKRKFKSKSKNEYRSDSDPLST
jgi:hypothetical protein